MKNFAKLYNIAVSVTEKKCGIPALGCILIDADKHTMLFTDMDIALMLSDIPVTGKGKQLFDAHTLASVLKKPGLKSIALAGDTLTVKSDYDYTLKSIIPVDNFPIMTAFGNEAFKASLNSNLLDAVNYATSTEATRYYLNGVYIHNVEGVIKSAATDGHRLCLHDTQIACAPFEGFIIPRKTTFLLPRLMDDFMLEYSGSKIRCTSGNIEIVSKLVDGNFPDYNWVIPSIENAILLKTDWKKAAKFCADNKGNSGVKLTQEGDKLTQTIAISEDCTVTNTLINTSGGVIPVCGFNARYFSEMVSRFVSDDATGYFLDSVSPAVFKSGSELHVLMLHRV